MVSRASRMLQLLRRACTSIVHTVSRLLLDLARAQRHDRPAGDNLMTAVLQHAISNVTSGHNTKSCTQHFRGQPQNPLTWDFLPDDIWAHIVGYLDFPAKLRMQQTCRRFHSLLANPLSANIWGRLELPALKADTSVDVSQVCGWVQRRLKGISALYYIHWDANGLPTMWHALVGSTSGTAIRLRLRTNFFATCKLLVPPVQNELIQRLTALDICVAHMGDIAVVHSLAALRQLQMTCSAQADLLPWDSTAHDAGRDSQLTRLRTLQLANMLPDAFFLPGTAARMQQLDALRLQRCDLVAGALPAEVLRLPSLSRLVLVQLPLGMMPDLRRLPALQVLIMSGLAGMPKLDPNQAECSAGLKTALRVNPLGCALGVTEAMLHGIPILTQQCAEAIERLPQLKALGLDFAVSEEGAFWAAILQQRMQGRCVVQPAPGHITNIDSAGQFSPLCHWSTDDS